MGVPAMCASANILDSTHIYDDGDVPYGSLYFLTTISVPSIVPVMGMH